MDNFGERVSFIGSVADLLRGPYRPNQYKDVMLPLIDRAICLTSSAGSNGGMLADYRDALVTAAVTGKIDVRSMHRDQ